MKTMKILCLLAVISTFSCTNVEKKEKNDVSAKDSIVVDPTSNKSIFAGNRAKQVEYFEFVNSKGFMYKGKGGTVLIFKPNSFECGSNEKIRMEVAEYTELEAMVKSNLSTTSNGKLIETNGMIYCKAYDKSNKELALKKGKSYTCMFEKSKKKGFMLFEGKEENGTVNWVNPVPEKKTENPAMKTPAKQAENTARDVLYCGAYGTEKEIDYLESTMTFVDKSLPFFTEYYFNKYNLTSTDLIPFAPDASVTLNFTLTKAGKLKFTSSDMPFKQAVKNRIIRWFEEMPAMAGFTDKNTKIKEDLDIYCILSPNDALAEKLRANTANMAIVDKVAAEQNAKEKAIEAKQIAEDKKQQELDEKAMEEYNKNLSIFKKTINKASKIVFESTKMGWINCDRFYNDPRPKIDLQFTNLNSDFNDYNIQLVYTSISSIVTLSNPVANNVPVNETIKIIFIGHKKDEIYFFSKKITTSINKKEIVLEPKKINPSDFDKLYHSALI